MAYVSVPLNYICNEYYYENVWMNMINLASLLAGYIYLDVFRDAIHARYGCSDLPEAVAATFDDCWRSSVMTWDTQPRWTRGFLEHSVGSGHRGEKQSSVWVSHRTWGKKQEESWTLLINSDWNILNRRFGNISIFTLCNLCSMRAYGRVNI